MNSDDVKYAVNNVRASRQAKFWGAVAFTGFFAAFGGLNLFSQMSKPMPADQKFFKWGGIYSRFHPEAGEEVGQGGHLREKRGCGGAIIPRFPR